MALIIRFRWNKSCAADNCWLTSPRNSAERGMVPRASTPRQRRRPSRYDSQRPTITSQRLGEDSPHERLLITARSRRRVVSAGPGGRPQRAAETWRWVRLQAAPAGHGHRHEPRSRIRRGPGRGGGSGQAGRRPQPRCCAWGPGAGVGEIEVVCSFDDWPVRVEREDRGGGGLARTAAPDHGNFLQ